LQYALTIKIDENIIQLKKNNSKNPIFYAYSEYCDIAILNIDELVIDESKIQKCFHLGNLFDNSNNTISKSYIANDPKFPLLFVHNTNNLTTKKPLPGHPFVNHQNEVIGILLYDELILPIVYIKKILDDNINNNNKNNYKVYKLLTIFHKEKKYTLQNGNDVLIKTFTNNSGGKKTTKHGIWMYNIHTPYHFQENDIITEIDGLELNYDKTVYDPKTKLTMDFRVYLNLYHQLNDSIQVKIIRDKKIITINVPLKNVSGSDEDYIVVGGLVLKEIEDEENALLIIDVMDLGNIPSEQYRGVQAGSLVTNYNSLNQLRKDLQYCCQNKQNNYIILIIDQTYRIIVNADILLEDEEYIGSTVDLKQRIKSVKKISEEEDRLLKDELNEIETYVLKSLGL